MKVVDVDARSRLLDIDGLEGYRAVRALVRLHGTPIGYADVPVVDGACSARALANAIASRHGEPILRHLVHNALAAAPLAPLPALDHFEFLTPPLHEGPLPSVTIAVCSRDRRNELEACLAALSRLHYPRLELLMVDNAPSDDGTEHLIRAAYPAVRYLREPRPGLNWARNRALLEARGEIVAFTDDDARPDPGWVCALARLFAEHPDVAAVTGLVAPLELETNAQLIFEHHQGARGAFERRWYSADPARRLTAPRHGNTGPIGFGVNMAFRRHIFQRIGYFDPALDVGTATHAGGDLDIFFRVLKAGYDIVYEPRAVVWHRHRRELAQLESQLAEWTCGLYSAMVRNALAHPEERVAFAALAVWLLGAWYGRRWASSFVGGDVPSALARAELRGGIAGLRRYPEARRTAEAIASHFGELAPLRGPASSALSNGHGARRGAGGRRATGTRRIDLSDRLRALTDVTAYARVGIDVTRAGRTIGRVRVENHGRPISVTRLRDAIAHGLPLGALGIDHGRAAAELRAHLAE